MSEQEIKLTQKERELIMSSRRSNQDSSHPQLPTSQTHLNPDADNQSRPANPTAPTAPVDEKMEDFDWADEVKNETYDHAPPSGQFTTSAKYGYTRVMSPDEALRYRQTNLRSANELFEAKKKSKVKSPTRPFDYDRFSVRTSDNVTPPLSQRTDVPVTESPTHVGSAPKVPAYLIQEKKKRQLANAGIYGMDGNRNVALP